MNCKCGGRTTEKEVQEDKQVVKKYECCTACGRTHTWKNNGIPENPLTNAKKP